MRNLKIMVKTFDSIKQKMFDLKIVCERKNFGSPEKDDFFFFLNKRFFKAKMVERSLTFYDFNLPV